MQRPPNRLAGSASPYLRQHAHNPVDWYPWGEEALERARIEQKPIFLSIGYSACHWCHVMEKDAFSVEEVAEILNRHFVSIKVDREERPDLDHLYQGVVQLMGKGGGWPLSVFLTPGEAPFFGGTYFPPEDSFGLPGFRRVLLAVADLWANRREEALQSAATFSQGLGGFLRIALGRGQRPPDESDLATIARSIMAEEDRVHGGFFGAPKFPHPTELAFLLRIAAVPSGIDPPTRGAAAEAVRRALDAMAAGGFMDQLGGGFHRYAMDAAWRVPHFEKMLYDNALLLRLYAEASRALGEGRWEGVARGVVRWLTSEMTAPNGAFFASQDADSEGVEGKYYVWTPEEVEEVLGPDLGRLASSHWGISPAGDLEGGASVPRLAATGEQLAASAGGPPQEARRRLEEARRLLLERRARRAPPATDEKVLASWNGLAIGALAAAARHLEDPSLARMAREAASGVLTTHWSGGELLRTGGDPPLPAFLDDHAFLCEGLLELFESTGEERWLEVATALGRKILEDFWDDVEEAFFLAGKGGEALLHRVVSAQDEALPSGGSASVAAFLRLFALTGEDAFGRVAERYLRRQQDSLLRHPFGFGHLLGAAWLHQRGICEVAILGPPGPSRDALLRVGRERFRPDVFTYVSDRGAGPLLAGRGGVDGSAAAWICRNFACEAPRTEPEELRLALYA